jgi:hypothetical protein
MKFRILDKDTKEILEEFEYTSNHQYLFELRRMKGKYPDRKLQTRIAKWNWPPYMNIDSQIKVLEECVDNER